MELERLTPPLMSAHIAALRSAGVASVEALVVLQPHNVMQITGVALLDALVFLRAASVILCPIPSTVSELLSREQERRPFIPTPIPALTTALRGGLAPTVTEVVGPAGAGKTQFCLTMMVTAATVEEGVTPPGDCGPPCVILIETEGAFSAMRLRQVAQESRPDLYGACAAPAEADRNIKSLLGRIRVYREETARGLLARIRSLDSEVLADNVRLIVIDSVASPAWAADAGTGGRAHDGRSAAGERTSLLAQQAAALKQLADSFHLPVLVTNQVVARGRYRHSSAKEPRPDDQDSSSKPPAHAGNGRQSDRAEMSALEIDGELMPALGPTWAHCVSTRLLLLPSSRDAPAAGATALGPLASAREPPPSRPSGSAPASLSARGTVTIVKSPCAPQLRFDYAISARGWGPVPVLQEV